jgi:hypothetical protein
MQERRAQKRIPVSMLVMIQGVDAQGQTFAELARVNDVSRRGLSVLTQREIVLDASLTVAIPNRRTAGGNFSANATVIGVRKQGEFNRVSLRFVGATLPLYSSETL